MEEIPKIAKNLAKNLKLKRTERNLTQIELGKMAKITDRYISKLEAGANVTLDKVEAIATALGVEPEELISDPKKKVRKQKQTLEFAVKVLRSYEKSLDEIIADTPHQK